MTSVAVIGAGIVGLAVSHALRARGHEVRLVDPEPPGEGTSFGNAGLIANYATAPMASPETLRQLPAMLARSDRSIGIDPGYTPALAGFGWRFLRAARPARFARHKADLVQLIDRAITGQHALLDALGGERLYRAAGCLQVFRDAPCSPSALDAMAAAKRADGVACEALGPADVLGLEPELSAEGLGGALYFPETRSLRDPLNFSRCLHRALEGEGFTHVSARVEALTPLATGGWRLQAGETRLEVERVVLCAGIANNDLLRSLGMRLPVVSERGYHVMLETPLALNRPVGWLTHHFYATPMQEGIRLAGTTEFCPPGKAPNGRRWSRLADWGTTLFGRPVEVAKEWVGVRHSTPDGLPVIGEVPGQPGLMLAFGHGHLGLTLSAETGRLVAGLVDGEALPEDAQALSPQRFLNAS
ncbi:D-amino acid dehydrogenase small subunit [Halomonas sp. THAF5a]|uniref:NAD(P)/FAD-dependent oxidoreductase n=1 Tax=Halomonas sp. THAF5a TaxID=2587844 RepID=UPI0012694F61|nr:FAD-binding oxidoreductase [Halomonas sp. THAF5a]QFU00812.1 D-amino acid dehydrogenase small subunit [Halomonas sp. THAF5a]